MKYSNFLKKNPSCSNLIWACFTNLWPIKSGQCHHICNWKSLESIIQFLRTLDINFVLVSILTEETFRSKFSKILTQKYIQVVWTDKLLFIFKNKIFFSSKISHFKIAFNLIKLLTFLLSANVKRLGNKKK